MEHVNGWCFRGIYKGGLWEDDLHVSAPTDLPIDFKMRVADLTDKQLRVFISIADTCIHRYMGERKMEKILE